MTQRPTRIAARKTGVPLAFVIAGLLAGCTLAHAEDTSDAVEPPQVASLPPEDEIAIPPGAPEYDKESMRCLALTIYFEARSEGREFRRAVAHVVLNRLSDPRFPKTLCGVVKQGGETRNACQFSWWCDGKPDTPYNKVAWGEAKEIAQHVIGPDDPDPTAGALYFHDGTVEPDWAHRLKRTATIGTDRFYQ